MIMFEEWRDIKGYESIYKVSNLGNVMRLAGKVLGKDGKLYTIPQRQLLLRKGPYNSRTVQLSKNGEAKNYQVHRLVAEAFIPNPNNYPIINHKDEYRSNNCIDNLEWCTPKYNTNYGNCRKKMSEKAKLHVGKLNNFYGKHHTDATKKRIHNSKVGKLCGESNPFYGKHHSEITKQKISESKRKKSAISKLF